MNDRPIPSSGSPEPATAHDRAYAQLRSALVELLPPPLAAILTGLLDALEHARQAPQTAAGLYEHEVNVRAFIKFAALGAVDAYRDALAKVIALQVDAGQTVDWSAPAGQAWTVDEPPADEQAPVPAVLTHRLADVELTYRLDDVRQLDDEPTADDQHFTERRVLGAAGDGWPAVLPAGARVLSREDNLRRDAVELAGGQVLYRSEETPFGDGRWWPLGWSYASRGHLVRDIPLSRQRGTLALPRPVAEALDG